MSLKRQVSDPLNPFYHGSSWGQQRLAMFKLIGIIIAAMPVVLFLRAIFKGRSTKPSKAWSDLKKQIDYVVWAILFMIGCGVVYAIAKLVLTWGNR